MKQALFTLFTSGILLTQVAARNVSMAKDANLYFMENKGQVTDQYHNQRPDINFRMSTSDGLNLFIGNNQIHYQWAKPIYHDKLKPGDANRNLLHSSVNQSSSLNPQLWNMYRMDVTLIGANPKAQIITDSKLAYYELYYLTGQGNAATAHTFQKIIYKNIYPNIDWTLYINPEGKLEYDFTVYPGGKVSDIQLKFEGSSSLQVNEDGSLTSITPMGSVTEKAPYSFQEDGKQVKSTFRLKGNILSFETENYDGILTVDPTLEWATYYGGNSTDYGRFVACDQKGGVYMTGSASSTSNIATTGAHQTTCGGGSDAFLAKFDSSGARLWATYYGGSGDEQGWSVTCDVADNVYLAGQTGSTNNIASKGYKNTYSGGTDAFLAKFNTSGTLQWATYYGGSSNDEGWSVACDHKGHVYFAGRTYSDTGIATSGTHQQNYDDGGDAFLVKFDTSGARLWGTYYGGSGVENTFAIACDQTGNIYMSGETGSKNNITTPGAHEATTTKNGGSESFVAKFNDAGILKWGTYYGGDQPGQVFGSDIACDDSGAVYMVGYTVSTVDIATPGSHQPVSGGGYDAFLVKFDSTGDRLWGTYYGGQNSENGYGVVCDPQGNVYITGYSDSKEAIATSDGIQTTHATGNDFFVAKFNRQGVRQWGTYYGAGGYDAGWALAHDGYGNLYVTGFTNGNGLSTTNAFQPALGGNFDALLFRISECFISSPLGISGPDSICPNATVVYSIPPVAGADAYTWQLPAGWTGNSTTDSITVTANGQGGTISVVAHNNCDTSSVQTLDIALYHVEHAVITTNEFELGTVASYSTYQWLLNGNIIPGATDSTYNVTENGVYTVIVTTAEGCVDTSAPYTVNNASDINDVNAIAPAIKIYPNPASDFITIQNLNHYKTEQLAVLNILGQVLYKEELKHISPEYQVTTSGLASGIYLLRIKTKEGYMIKKFEVRK